MDELWVIVNITQLFILSEMSKNGGLPNDLSRVLQVMHPRGTFQFKGTVPVLRMPSFQKRK